MWFKPPDTDATPKQEPTAAESKQASGFLWFKPPEPPAAVPETKQANGFLWFKESVLECRRPGKGATPKAEPAATTSEKLSLIHI